MRIRVIHLTKPLLLALSVMFSCDTFEGGDTPDNEITLTKTDLFTLPESSIIVDLNSIIGQSFVKASISISKYPDRGSLIQLNPQLIKYKPNREFFTGEDYFTLSITSESKVVTTQNVNIHMKGSLKELPCTTILIEDKALVQPNSPSYIPILSNDRFCDIDKSELIVSIYLEPKFGQAKIDSESIIYIPSPEYKIRDELIYQIVNPSSQRIFYGVISISSSLEELNSSSSPLDVPNSSLHKLIFVNENVGYLGGYGLYKTIDKGESWSEVLIPEPFIIVDDICFINEMQGFVLYYTCDFDPACGYTGIAKTTNGGLSWEINRIGITNSANVEVYNSANSLFFTSSNTGFAGIYTWKGSKLVNEIHKTDDGGATWKQVLEVDGIFNQDLEIYSLINVKFSDSQIGYAHQPDRILITRDAGKTWKTFLTHNYIQALEVVENDEIFTNLTTPTSSEIVKFHGNPPIKETITNTSYKVTQIKFSPSGTVGIAAGIRGSGSQARTLLITVSTDKGENWKSVIIDRILPPETPFDYPVGISVPSDHIAYIVYNGRFYKYQIK